MKKFIYFFLFFLVSLAANSQVQRPANTPSPNSPTGYSLYGYVRADSGFIWKQRDTFPAKFPTIIWHTNGNFYKTNGNGGAWSLFVSGTASTVSSVSGNAPISVANGTTTPTISVDTSYNGLTTKKWLYKSIDSLGFLKLNISDTAAMLLTRLKVSDTAFMLSGYLRKADTSAMLSSYVPTFRTIGTNAPLFGGGNLSANRTLGADTGRNSAQLVTGGSLTAVKDSLVALIASSGGGTVLSVATTDGYGIVSSVADPTSTPNISLRVDTVSISTRDWRQKGIDSVQANLVAGLALKLNLSDTAAMLSNRFKISDTLTMLLPYLRKSDTSFMLSPYRRTTTKITNSDLANSTISGVSLGSNLQSLTFGQYLQVGASSYNGSVATTITTNGTSTNAGSTLVARDINGDFSARNISATQFLGTASSASTVAITNDITTNATYYPMFSTVTTGSTSTKVSSSKLTYNPSTGMLSSTGFTGALTGNASTATVLQTPRTINGVAFDGSADITISSAVGNSLTAGYGITGSPFDGSLARTWVIDTSNISTKANVTGALVAKLNIYDTAAMLSGYKTYYPRTAISAGTGISYNAATGVITNSSPSSGGTVTSVATSAPITGGTITSTGTIGITQSTTTTDGYLSSTDWNTFNNKASTASVALKLNISDTAAMLSKYFRTTTQLNDTTFVINRPDATADTIQLSFLVPDTTGKLSIIDTSAMLAPYRRASTKITNSDLANSTISGIALGSNLNNLTAGNGLSGTAYNGGTAYTWQVDTSTISTKANVTGLLVGYATTGNLALKLNISDTATMLSGYKTYYPRTAISAGTGISYNAATGVITNSSPSSGGTVTSVATNNGSGITGGTITSTGTIAADTSILSTKANVNGLLVGYTATGRFLDSLTNVQSRIQTKQPLGNYLTFADSSTILAGRWLPNRSSDSIAVIRALANTKQPIGNYITFADSTTILAGRWLPNRSADSTAVLRALINTKGTGNGTVTSIATNTGTGITGGTITSTGTLAIDTATTISTKANVTGTLVGYTTVSRFTDSLTNVQSRIQTKQPLGAYITLADSSTILAGRWLPNRSADSIAVIRALANSKGTGSVTSVATGVGLSGGTITTSGTISADTTTLSTRAYVTGALVGYTTVSRFTDSLTNVQTRIQTKQPLGNYLTFADSSTILAGRWLPNRSADSIAVIRALANTKGVGTVTSVAASAGTGISVSGSPITSSGTITITNTAPDQTVTLTAGTGISVTGTYPNFTVTNSSPSSGGTVTSVTASAPLSSSGGTTPNITISQATTSTNGFLTSTDWNTFNDKASTASVALKLNISDTATMMSKSFRTTTQVNDTTFTINRPDGTKDTIALSVQVPSTSQLVYNTALTTDADYSLGLSDTYVQLVSTSTPRTLTLPAASTCLGRVVILNSKVGGGSGWTSTQTIYTTYPTTGGVTSLNGSVDTIISNGTNWIFLTRY